MKLGKVTSIFQKKDIDLVASSTNSNTFDRDGLSRFRVGQKKPTKQSCEDERGEDVTTTILNVAIPTKLGNKR
ncbi:hypothetical protein [Vibrio jasicida]|uniref:hypothetical protein n=1 Tax=Vibrio jasicida TaxID=766224 RepID=UPI0015E20396|nr:hypothetical protein [Vibrio jasicida]